MTSLFEKVFIKRNEIIKGHLPLDEIDLDIE